jgi:hypothetical protein
MSGCFLKITHGTHKILNPDTNSAFRKKRSTLDVLLRFKKYYEDDEILKMSTSISNRPHPQLCRSTALWQDGWIWECHDVNS